MMLATGKLSPAEHALRIGLINEIQATEALDAAVESLCDTINAKAASVIRRGKASFRRQLELPPSAAYDFVRSEALDHINRPDAQGA